MCSLLSAYLLLSGSGFQATAHNDAHNAFMTIPPYTRSREARRLSRAVATNPAGWAFELGSAMSKPDMEAVENIEFTSEMLSYTAFSLVRE